MNVDRQDSSKKKDRLMAEARTFKQDILQPDLEAMEAMLWEEMDVVDRHYSALSRSIREASWPQRSRLY